MTSGLIVTAKEHMSHRLLSIDFQQGKLSKSYVALVDGSPNFEQRLIELPIGQRPGGNTVLMSARPDAKNSRPARTKVTVTERFTNHSLVECVLLTGRNHQIRVHLSEIGYPIAGDEYYGPRGTIRKSPRFDGDEPAEDRHALHAASLGFFHPILSGVDAVSHRSAGRLLGGCRVRPASCRDRRMSQGELRRQARQRHTRCFLQLMFHRRRMTTLPRPAFPALP